MLFAGKGITNEKSRLNFDKTVTRQQNRNLKRFVRSNREQKSRQIRLRKGKPALSRF